MKLKSKYSDIDKLFQFSIFIIIFFFTYFFSSYYVEGDQFQYKIAYDVVKDLGIVDAFIAYQFRINSTEPIHFFIVWIFSNLNIDKNLIMALSNAVLANIISRILIKRNVSLAIIFIIVTTNFYLYVLYFAAERLKFSFLFFFLAILFINKKKKSITLMLLSVVTHVQILVLIFSFIFSNVILKISSFFSTSKIKISFKNLVIIIFAAFPIFYLYNYFSEHILSKFTSYSDSSSSKGLIQNIWQPVFFAIVSYHYSKQKKSTILIFLFIILCSSLVGPERITMMAYIVFLFYALNINRGINYGVILSSFYFFIKSIGFISNVLKNGHGF
jgi:hypothetical protein